MGFYYTPFLMVWLGARGLVHGPRPEQNHPTSTERMHANGRTLVRALWSASPGSWFPVHGPRQDGSISPRQVLCSKMGSVLSFGMVTN